MRTPAIPNARFFLLVLGLIGLLACLLGCEPKVSSPFTGKPATAAEITYQHESAVAAAKAAADKEAADAKAHAEAAARQTAVDAKKAQREFQAAVSKLDAESAASVATLNAQFESTIDQLNASIETVLAQAKSRAAEASTTASAQIAQFNGQADAALADIERQKQAIAGIAGLVQFIPGAAAVPGLGPGLAVLTSILGVGAAGVQTVRKRTSDARAAESKKEADAAQDAEDAAKARASQLAAQVAELDKASRSIVNMLDVVRSKVPAVADAMKTNKGEFVGQLTDTAKKIIQDERIT